MTSLRLVTLALWGIEAGGSLGLADYRSNSRFSERPSLNFIMIEWDT